MRRLLVVVACLGLFSIIACGKSSPTSPAAPTPTPSSTRIIALSGNLAFGNVTVGTKAQNSVNGGGRQFN